MGVVVAPLVIVIAAPVVAGPSAVAATAVGRHPNLKQIQLQKHRKEAS